MLDVAVFGGGLHVTVDDRGSGHGADSRSAGRDGNRDSDTWSRSQPSMEDVFVA